MGDHQTAGGGARAPGGGDDGQDRRWQLAGRNRDGAEASPRSELPRSRAHDDNVLQWLLDRAAIEDLIALCALAIDRRDFETVQACFTPEAVISFGKDTAPRS